jgi:hypothetical protein
MDERPQLGASEIEAELQKLPALHDIQSVSIRPYSGPKSWTWEVELGPQQIGFAGVETVVGRLQQQYDLDPDA